MRYNEYISNIKDKIQSSTVCLLVLSRTLIRVGACMPCIARAPEICPKKPPCPSHHLTHRKMAQSLFSTKSIVKSRLRDIDERSVAAAAQLYKFPDGSSYVVCIEGGKWQLNPNMRTFSIQKLIECTRRVNVAVLKKTEHGYKFARYPGLYLTSDVVLLVQDRVNKNFFQAYYDNPSSSLPLGVYTPQGKLTFDSQMHVQSSKRPNSESTIVNPKRLK